jgi:hypothetical protein
LALTNKTWRTKRITLILQKAWLGLLLKKKEIAKSEGKTIPQLAAEYNVSHRTIVNSKRRFGVKKLKRVSDKPSIIQSKPKIAGTNKII